MTVRKRLVLVLVVLLVGLALAAAVVAAPLVMPLVAPGAPDDAPSVVAYQGEVQVSGTPYDGTGYFKFAVVDSMGTTYWSNDGTSDGEPAASVGLPVADGLFAVLLGDTSLGGMTQALDAPVFADPDRQLRIWFATTSGGTFDQLSPDTRVASVPYALQANNADTVDGFDADQLGADYENVVIVAKSGGDYTSVQAAIDSITDAAADNAYLVWVAPGVYNEMVVMKPHVHVQGAGQEATIITDTVSSAGWPPDAATLTLERDSSLRDLTVGNGGSGWGATAISAITDTERVLVADVTARAEGTSDRNWAIVLNGTDLEVLLQDVTAAARQGVTSTMGLMSVGGAMVSVRGGVFSASGGGGSTYGIFVGGAGTTLGAEGVTALGAEGSLYNYGLGNYDGGDVTLRGGHYTGRGGLDAHGVSSARSSAMFVDAVTTLAEDASAWNYALDNYKGSTMVVHGGSYTAQNGENTIGISNEADGATIEIVGATAVGRYGSEWNWGIHNADGGQAKVVGGSYTGIGGANAYGIMTVGDGTHMDAENATAEGFDGTQYNWGISNIVSATAALRGGVYIGRFGVDAHGVDNSVSATMTVANVTALAEQASEWNYALGNYDNATMVVHGGSYTGRYGGNTIGVSNGANGCLMSIAGATGVGREGSGENHGFQNFAGGYATVRNGTYTALGGTLAHGVSNLDPDSTLVAEGITAAADGAGGANWGIANGPGATADLALSLLQGVTSPISSTGTITVSNSRLAGGAVTGTGSVICVLVTRGTTISDDGSTCP